MEVKRSQYDSKSRILTIDAVDLVVLFVLHVLDLCWTSEDDLHGFGGISHDIGSAEECRQKCLTIKTCVAVDWEPTNSGKTCWTLTDPYTRPTLYPAVEHVHYALNPACRR